MLLGRKCPKKQKKNAGKVKGVDRNDMVFRIVTVQTTQFITIFDGISVLQKVTVSHKITKMSKKKKQKWLDLVWIQFRLRPVA